MTTTTGIQPKKTETPAYLAALKASSEIRQLVAAEATQIWMLFNLSEKKTAKVNTYLDKLAHHLNQACWVEDTGLNEEIGYVNYIVAELHKLIAGAKSE